MIPLSYTNKTSVTLARSIVCESEAIGGQKVSSSLDNRKFPRKPFHAKVRIHDNIHGKWTSGEALDINPMGLLLVPRRQFTIGETLDLSFPSTEGDYNLTVSGEVMRLDEESDRKGAVAVEFFGMEDWIFDELCRYVYGQEKDAVLTVNVPSPGDKD